MADTASGSPRPSRRPPPPAAEPTRPGAPAAARAAVAVHLGQPDLALQHLGQALEQNALGTFCFNFVNPGLVTLDGDPLLLPLRNDARFRALARHDPADQPPAPGRLEALVWRSGADGLRADAGGGRADRARKAARREVGRVSERMRAILLSREQLAVAYPAPSLLPVH